MLGWTLCCLVIFQSVLDLRISNNENLGFVKFSIFKTSHGCELSVGGEPYKKCLFCIKNALS